MRISKLCVLKLFLHIIAQTILDLSLPLNRSPASFPPPGQLVSTAAFCSHSDLLLSGMGRFLWNSSLCVTHFRNFTYKGSN